VGIYRHVSEAHLHRYLAEFDFRYNRRISLDAVMGRLPDPGRLGGCPSE
jgi:hypothetical protein